MIGDAADDPFPGSRGVLDFSHAARHLGTVADGLFGDAGAAGREWYAAARGVLLRDGGYGLQEHSGRMSSEPVSDAGRAAVDELVTYSANHANRLDDRHRLATGEPIGSGLIEGACPQVIGKRRTPTGARWTVPDANRMADLCGLTDSDPWADSWNAV